MAAVIRLSLSERALLSNPVTKGDTSLRSVERGEVILPLRPYFYHEEESCLLGGRPDVRLLPRVLDDTFYSNLNRSTLTSQPFLLHVYVQGPGALLSSTLENALYKPFILYYECIEHAAETILNSCYHFITLVGWNVTFYISTIYVFCQQPIEPMFVNGCSIFNFHSCFHIMQYILSVEFFYQGYEFQHDSTTTVGVTSANNIVMVICCWLIHGYNRKNKG